MWPPSVLRLRIQNQRHRFGLWLPLFFIWPLIVVFSVVLLPLVLVLTIILWHSGLGKAVLLTGPLLFRVLCALRGLEVGVKQYPEQIFISFR